ncbi:hypothetical protein [Xanthobacter pseudotagetidis]|uniref:hypothetical protein n=1 Tax=Xanthobacter pseudotagetidis TaxID=3119911 RepID=UPI0037266CBA
MKPPIHRARSRPLMLASGEMRAPAVARPLVVVPAGHRQPVAWTAHEQSSAGKFAAAWGTIGGLTVVALLTHCTHPVMAVWLWLLGP